MKIIRIALNIALILLSVFVLSCDNETETKTNEVKKKIIPNNELINTENLCITENFNGDMKWDMISRSKIRIEAISLDKTLKLLVPESSSRVVIRGEHLNPVMKIIYSPNDLWESSTESNCELVVDSLMTYYDFEILEGKETMPVYILESFDSTYLNARSDNAIGHSSSITLSKAKYKNYTINNLFRELENEFNIVFESKKESYDKYDLEFNIVNKDSVLTDLQDNYGFVFTVKEKPIDVAIIQF
jgi:hypothetical protein